MQIIRGMRSEDYHAVRAASSTRLKEIMRSPSHLRWMDENGKTATALAMGSAFHTMALEPEKFNDEYAVAPECDRRTKDGKAAWQSFADANIGKVILSMDDANAVTSMAMAIQSHSTASELLQGRSDTEISLFWTDSILGSKCKARLDAVNIDAKCIIDLKSTQDASRDSFARSIANFGYHIQAAWYIDAARLAGFDVETIIFVAVEKTAPYGVACYTLDPEAIEQGRNEVRKALTLLSNCEASNYWPGYTSGIESLSLPRWAVRGEEVTL